MPNYYSRLNLASAIFPFYTEAAGRTIMTPQLDENWDRNNAANTVQDKGVPQVFYMHNVLPIAGGFQSVGFLPTLPPIVPAQADFDQMFPLRNSDLSRHLFVPAGGKNYIFDPSVGSWASISPIPAGKVRSNVLVTTAFVQGQTYIYYANYGCFKYDNVNKVLTPVTLTSLDPTQVVGITAANGYLIAWTYQTLAWSNLTNPTDFTPSIQTGAGGGNIQDAKGRINFCLPITGGFLIYCEDNIVGASYTGNSQYPFQFLEVTNSGGVSTPDKVGWEFNLDNHLAITTVGIQSVNKNNAVFAMPEVSDFLAAQIYEDFNETTNQFTTTYLTTQVAVKIYAVSSRYIVISYGPDATNYTHAIVYDNALNRFGKLKITHRCVFGYTNPSPAGVVTYNQLLAAGITIGAISSNTVYSDFFTTTQIVTQSKKNFAVLQQDGTIKLLDFELSEANGTGVFIIGKFQMDRASVIVHQRTDVETLLTGNNFSLSLLPTFDGKTFSPIVGTNANYIGSQTRTYARRYTASNISLLLKGAFNLTSLIINFTRGGSR